MSVCVCVCVQMNGKGAREAERDSKLSVSPSPSSASSNASLVTPPANTPPEVRKRDSSAGVKCATVVPRLSASLIS